MAVPISQMWTVTSYVLRQKLAGRKQYPLVLMLEPLFRCNLACAGCGKIQYPAHILKKQLSPEECFRAVDECGAPMVSIPGGEPLMHPQIGEIVEGLVARKRYIYLCTNALLLPKSVRAFFDEMMELGVEGMMLSPGYSYDKAPDQKHFLGRARTRRMFRAILSNRDPNWRFNLSPLFLEFLMGKRTYPCTPWGMPTYNVFGWQKPCYLLQDGYAETFAELLATTEWQNYGTESGNPACANCMVHSGYEASAVNATFSSLGGFLATVKATLTTRYRDEEALRLLEEPAEALHPLIHIAGASESNPSFEETRA